MWNRASWKIKLRTAEALRVASATAHFTEKVAVLWVVKIKQRWECYSHDLPCFLKHCRAEILTAHFNIWQNFFLINQASHKLEFNFNAPGKVSQASLLVIKFFFLLKPPENPCFILILLQMPWTEYPFRKICVWLYVSSLRNSSFGDLHQRAGLNLGLKQRYALLAVIMEI